jgi:hypothetical protein
LSKRAKSPPPEKEEPLIETAKEHIRVSALAFIEGSATMTNRNENERTLSKLT